MTKLVTAARSPVETPSGAILCWTSREPTTLEGGRISPDTQSSAKFCADRPRTCSGAERAISWRVESVDQSQLRVKGPGSAGSKRLATSRHTTPRTRISDFVDRRDVPTFMKKDHDNADKDCKLRGAGSFDRL